MTVVTRMDEPTDAFPVGMRVLAVDDDPTCLLVLETLLRRCKYHVTTTSQAVVALKMLRENKNQFHLVISDVHMPDMDGFKLLELVGLEMDLPVIMLSANDDTKSVMNGIAYGACDYLLKPVRIEELKNIWQHVVRRKKFDSMDQNNAGRQENPQLEDGGLPSQRTGNSDQAVKFAKKRKDQNEDENDEGENGHDSEDSTTQKKARVVWSVELHRKFVVAVNQLGVDKAVPKKILDLMKVNKLTRENVASHLQKYRLYLKRISCVANQQANMVAALGSSDPSYMRMCSLNALGNLQISTGSKQFNHLAFKSCLSSGMLGQLNTPSGLSLHRMPSSGMIQLGRPVFLNNSMNGQLNLQPATLHGNHNGSAFQELPISLELDQLQQNEGVTFVEGMNTRSDDKTHLTEWNGCLDPKSTVGCSSMPSGVMNNLLETNHQNARCARVYENQPSVSAASCRPEFSASLDDHCRSTDSWSSAVQPTSRIQTNSYQLNHCCKEATSHSRDNMSSIPSHARINPCDLSSISPLSAQSQNLRTEMHFPGIISNSTAGNVINDASFQQWNDHNQDSPYHSNVFCSEMKTMIPINVGVALSSQTREPKTSEFNRNTDIVSISQSYLNDPFHMKDDEVKNSVTGMLLKPNRGYSMNRQHPEQSCLSNNNLGSLEDLVSAIMKQGQGN